MNKSKVIIIVGLVVFCIIIVLPPIMRGYVYPNIGDDTAAHMNILDTIGLFAPGNENLEQIRYSAIYIVGYPLDLVSHIFSVSKDTLFFWFNYLALIGVGLSLFFIFKDLVSLSAGIVALVLPIFTSYSMLLLFYSGVVFEIINIGIILPLACYFTIKWLMAKNKRYAISAICLFLLFATFHSTGIYLPFIILASLASFIIYRAMKRQAISKWGVLYTVVAVSCFIVLFMLFNPILENIFQAVAVPYGGISGLPLLQESLLHYMSYFTLVILIISVAFLVGKYRQISDTEKLTVVAFGALAVLMLPAILFGWSPQPFRQGMALAIFLSMVAVALLGIVIRLDKRRVVVLVLVGLVIGGGTINANSWLGNYNSALERIDIEAIEYINSLPGEYYSSSDNVDPWIYSRYVEKKHRIQGGDILVVRNMPMKSKVALVEDGDLTFGRVLLSKYIDYESGVEIMIYR